MRTFAAENCVLLILLFLFFVSSVQNISAELVQSTHAGNDACAAVTKPELCPINCFRPDPVCGVNGVTYWCGCLDALCAGVEVAKLGFCEVGSGGSAPLPGQALLLVHIVWLFLLAFSLLLGVF